MQRRVGCGCEGQGGRGAGRNNIGIHGVNVAMDWNIKIYMR